MTYFAVSDLPLFDADYDAAQLFFNNSMLFVVSTGDILAERNNFYGFVLVNSDTVN